MGRTTSAHLQQEWNQLLQTIPIHYNSRVTGLLASNATNI